MGKGKLYAIAVVVGLFAASVAGAFDGLNMNMGTLSLLSDAKSRSISPENYTGQKGAGAMADPSKDVRNVSNASHSAKDLGKGWKVNPFVKIGAGETMTIAEIKGSGAIQQIWMTPTGNWRTTIIRIYWDGEDTPSVECPVGDFFCSAYNSYAQVSSLAVCVNPGSAFNCYWKMPFRKSAKITMQNMGNAEMRLYYQVNYVLTEVDDDEGYFHAQYRQSKPTKDGLHTILDGVKGKGHYVGTYFAWRVNNGGWWGEGEVKFFMDGDAEYPTICGTGLEDYICGSYNFDVGKKYVTFSTPYSGLTHAICPKGTYAYDSGSKFSMYRWHITDPVRFDSDLRVNVQDLGWREGGRYNKQKSNVSTVAFWYQREPHAPFPSLPESKDLVME